MPNLEASYCHHVFLAFYILFPKTPTSPYGDSKNASNIMTRTPMVAAGNTTTDVVAKIRKGKSNLRLSRRNNQPFDECWMFSYCAKCCSYSFWLLTSWYSVMGKIHHHFHIHVVHVEALQACEFTDREYETILGHSKVKQLSLLPAVEMTVDFYILL